MTRTRWIVAALFAALLWTKPSASLADAKIAVVDLQRALNETEDGRQAQRRLKALFDKRQKELDGAKDSMKKKEETLQKQKGVLSKEAFDKKVEEFQTEFANLQNQYMEYQREVSSKEAELTQKILDK